MENRRDVSSRDTKIAQRAAAWLAQKRISPNMISIFSMVFACVSLLAFYLDYLSKTNHVFAMFLAVLGIQGRLIMNLLDGMVAIEFNQKSLVGGLYNEVPDRISDSVIIFGSGLMAYNYKFGMDLAYLAMLLSAFTAYIRTLGASLHCAHHFAGPMAKQHRMALITLSCIISMWYAPVFYIALMVMNLGLVLTCMRRLHFISRELTSKG